MIIAVDFDETLVKEDYPRIGEEIPFAVITMVNKNGSVIWT